jgi:hypothetical protein
MKKAITLLLFLLLAMTATAQDSNFNQYKYVIVNSKFDFVKNVDGYQTSSLTKFLFNKMGFVTFLDNEEFPNDLAINRCNALYADVKDDSGMLVTKSYIEIKDCRGRLLFTSLTGTSRSKEYIKAYRGAIRKAFESVAKIEYTYDPSLAEKTTVVVVKKDKPTVQQPKVEKIVKEPKSEKTEKAAKVKKDPVMVTQEVVVKETIPAKKEAKKETSKTTSVDVLYAQPNANGYQLVNTKPEIVFVLLKTNTANKFIIKDKNGTLVKDGDFWLAEYYDNGKLVTKKYQVKF